VLRTNTVHNTLRLESDRCGSESLSLFYREQLWGHTLPSVYCCGRDANFRWRRTGYKLFGNNSAANQEFAGRENAIRLGQRGSANLLSLGYSGWLEACVSMFGTALLVKLPDCFHHKVNLFRFYELVYRQRNQMGSLPLCNRKGSDWIIQWSSSGLQMKG